MLQNLTLTNTDIFSIIVIVLVILCISRYVNSINIKEKDKEINRLSKKIDWCESVIIQKEFKQWKQEYESNPKTPKHKDVFYTKEENGSFHAYIIEEVNYDNLFYTERKLETIGFKKYKYKYEFDEDLLNNHYHIKRYNNTIGDSYGRGGERFITKAELDNLMLSNEIYMLSLQLGKIPKETPNEGEATN